jgi:hypothetical protein
VGRSSTSSGWCSWSSSCLEGDKIKDGQVKDAKVDKVEMNEEMEGKAVEDHGPTSH